MNTKSIALIAAFIAIPLWTLAQNAITIKGRLSENTADSFYIINYTQNHVKTPSPILVKTANDGTFQAKIPTKTRFNTISFVKGNQQSELLLESGKKLEIALSLKPSLKTTVVDSQRHQSTMMALAYTKLGGLSGFANRLRQVNGTELETYESKLDSVMAVELNALKQITAANTPLTQYYTHQIQLLKENALLMNAATQLNQQGQQLTPERINALTESSKKAKRIVDDAYIYYPIYQDYLAYYYLYGYIYNNLHLAADLKSNVTNTIVALNAIPEKKSAALGIAKLLLMVQRSMNPKEWAAEAEKFSQKYQNDENGKAIGSIVADIQKFDVGKKAIDFQFTTIEGETKRLSDYKGKVVYLDFWASWCGPCRQQMPFAREIKTYFEGKDVVFLYVSIDDSDEKWKNGIASMQVEGVQTRSGGWGGAIPKLYNISSIPAYFLIDKNGNFAAPPPRPSQKQELIQQIEKLLQ